MKFVVVFPFALFIVVGVLYKSGAEGVRLVARLTRHGIRGNVTFQQFKPGEAVTVRVSLEPVPSSGNSPSEPFEIGIYSNPVDYSSKDFCGGIGNDVLVDLTKFVGDNGLWTSPMFTISPSDVPQVEILGSESTIWGRSVRVRSTKGPVRDICGSIQVDETDPDSASVKSRTIRARFRYPLAGSVWFRAVDFRFGSSSVTHSLIYHDLYDVSKGGQASSRQFPWLLYATEASSGKGDDSGGESCKNLPNNVYDPDGKSSSRMKCTKEQPDECALGDLGARHGPLEIGGIPARSSKKQVIDPLLTLPELGTRVLYLAVKDPDNPDSFYACSKLVPSQPRTAVASISSQGVNGSFTIAQDSPLEPTRLIINLAGLDELAGGFHVHQFPVPPPTNKVSKVCGETGGHFNPFGINFSKSPASGDGTHDEYEIGDLSGKHGSLNNLLSVDNSFAPVWDTMLPLWGSRSVSGRSIVIHKRLDSSRWVCATLIDSRPMMRAVVQFKWPFVGTVEFRQADGDPDAETTIFIESLVYSDTTDKDTVDHAWHVHVKPPASFQDSINWEKRCLSAEAHYNPFMIDVKAASYDLCTADSPEFCELGDLAKRWGRLKVVVDKARRNSTRVFFTDTFLPLAGRFKVVDRSIVVHAEEHPNRGNRLACSKIIKAMRHKGVVRDWRTDDSPERRVVGGIIEFTQESMYDPTRVKVSLDSLLGLAGGYHVHEVPVEFENEFPCLTSGAHWNPFLALPIDKDGDKIATVDKFEIGDLNGKHGNLNPLQDLKTEYVDSNLPLYGNTSIMGRSVVVHKLEGGTRWSCGNIGWGFSPDEADHRSAIASFHHPDGFVRGYIRFRQVVYKSGFETETFIEVNLRYTGVKRNDDTFGHNWAVYNALAGSDATVKYQSARCGSAGVRWAPIAVDSSKTENYNTQCGPDLPFRCVVGDMSGKVGPIAIGLKRMVLSDPHYPLTGNDNGMKRKSVVIFDKNGSGDVLACAPIDADDDIVRTVSMQKSGSYSQSQFMREVRDILGAPEWMVVSDASKTRQIQPGDCEHLTLRFMGPKANQLSQDFARLLQTGSLPTPTMSIPGLQIHPKRTLSYKQCSSSKTQPGDLPPLQSASPANLMPKLWPVFVGISVMLSSKWMVLP